MPHIFHVVTSTSLFVPPKTLLISDNSFCVLKMRFQDKTKMLKNFNKNKNHMRMERMKKERYLLILWHVKCVSMLWRVHKYHKCSVAIHFKMRKTKSRRSVPVDISYSFIDSCVEIFMECFLLLGWLISFIYHSDSCLALNYTREQKKSVGVYCGNLFVYFSLQHLKTIPILLAVI